MLLPSKHLPFAESILGLASYILQNLDTPASIDHLWNKYREDIRKKEFPVHHSFDNFMLALVLLYGINTIEEMNGSLHKCT